MKYTIDFQYLKKGAANPLNQGDVVKIDTSDETGFVVVPSVGDYISIDSDDADDKLPKFEGKVASRLFTYCRQKDGETVCFVNVVVEENNEDWSKLIKE